MDITVVLNAHNEGILAHPTMLSLQLTKAHAEQHGLAVEVLVLMDNPSAETSEYFSECKVLDFSSVRVSFGDLGLSRNAGVQTAKGKFVAFLDADDLWGPNWLTASHAAATSDMRSVVWHPEVNQYFGAHPHIFAHADMEDPTFDLFALTINNYWTSASFSSREIYLSHPFPASHTERQIGYEDWAWNSETIRHGIYHKIVVGTAHFIRQKLISMVRQMEARSCLMSPSPLFKDFIDKRISHVVFPCSHDI